MRGRRQTVLAVGRTVCRRVSAGADTAFSYTRALTHTQEARRVVRRCVARGTAFYCCRTLGLVCVELYMCVCAFASGLSACAVHGELNFDTLSAC